MRPLTPIAYCYAGALAVMGVLLLAGSLSINAPLFIALLVLGLIPAPILLYWAYQLEDQYEWLIKGHAKERATEVVTPPKQLRPFIKKLEADVAHAASLLMKYENSWQRRAFAGQWYGFAVACVAGAACLAALFFTDHLPTAIVPLLPQTPLATMSTLALGLGFAFACYIACAILIKAADENAEKLAQYLEQKSGKSVTIPPLRPTSMVPAIGIVAVLALIPVAFLQSNFEEQTTVQQQAIAQTKEAAKTLEQRLDETLEKKDFFATENAALLEQNQSLSTQVAKAKEVEKLLRTEIDKLKAAAKAMTQQQAQTTQKLKEVEATLATSTADLAKQTEVNTRLEAAQTQLNKEFEALKATKSTIDQNNAELQNKVTLLEEQLKAAQAAQKKAEATTGPLSLEGTKGLLPALATLSRNNQSIIMPVDVFFTPQTDIEEVYFMNNVKDLWNVLDARVQKNDGYTLKAYVYADALPPVAHSDNMALTAAQAAKLAKAFQDQGAPAAKVMVIPMGNTLELDTRLDPEALEANRRIEFMVLPTDYPLQEATPEPKTPQN